MMDFYNCRGGRQFIDGTVPRAIEAMNRLAKATERQNELKEIEMGLRPAVNVKEVAKEFETQEG